jgi:hypothetical protein
MTATEKATRIQNEIAAAALDRFANNLRRETGTELFFDIIVIRTYSPLKIPNQTIGSLTHRPLLVEQLFRRFSF